MTSLIIVLVFIVVAGVIFLEKEASKTQLGLSVLYLAGVLLFLKEIFSFYKKKAMRFRSLTFYHPQDKEMRVVIFFVSIIAVGGFSYALFDTLSKVL